MISVDSNVKLFLNVFVQHYDNLDSKYKQKNLEFVNDQLDSTRQPQAQVIALEYIPKIELGKKGVDMLNLILELGKSTPHDSVKTASKNTLKQLNRYGSKTFWEEAKKALGDDVYQK